MMSEPMTCSADVAAARRVTARISVWGIPTALLVAVVMEFLRLKSMFDNPPDIIGGVDIWKWYGLINDRTVMIAVGVLVLIAGGIITLVRRAWRDTAWSVGGILVLCASLAGYLWSFPNARSNRYRMEFDPDCVMGMLWMIFAIVVAVSLYRRGLCLQASAVGAQRTVFYRRIGRQIAAFLGMAAVIVIVSAYVHMQEMFATFDGRFLLELIVYTLVCLAVPLGIAVVYVVWSVCERSAYGLRNGRMIGRADEVLFGIAIGGQVLWGVGMLLLHTARAGTSGVDLMLNNAKFISLREALVSVLALLSVLAVIRFVAVLCTMGKARVGATVFGCTAIASQVMQWGQTMLQVFLVDSNSGSDGIQTYGEVLVIVNYVNLAITVVRLVALILVAVQLRREAGAFVFALPGVSILQGVVNLIVSRIVASSMDFTEIYVGMGIQYLISGIMGALFYAAVLLVLGRVRLPDTTTEHRAQEGLRKEDFLTEI